MHIYIYIYGSTAAATRRHAGQLQAMGHRRGTDAQLLSLLVLIKDVKLLDLTHTDHV